MLFIKAEATLRSSGDIAAAQGFYQAAITANMTKLGVSTANIATYITANGTLPTSSTDAAIAQVAQEYFALYLNPNNGLHGAVQVALLLYQLQEQLFHVGWIILKVNLILILIMFLLQHWYLLKSSGIINILINKAYKKNCPI